MTYLLVHVPQRNTAVAVAAEVAVVAAVSAAVQCSIAALLRSQ
jgi:hypothetical protein